MWLMEDLRYPVNSNNHYLQAPSETSWLFGSLLWMRKFWDIVRWLSFGIYLEKGFK